MPDFSISLSPLQQKPSKDGFRCGEAIDGRMNWQLMSNMERANLAHDIDSTVALCLGAVV